MGAGCDACELIGQEPIGSPALPQRLPRAAPRCAMCRHLEHWHVEQRDSMGRCGHPDHDDQHRICTGWARSAPSPVTAQKTPHEHDWFREAMAELDGSTSYSRTATCLICFAETRMPSHQTPKANNSNVHVVSRNTSPPLQTFASSDPEAYATAPQTPAAGCATPGCGHRDVDHYEMVRGHMDCVECSCPGYQPAPDTRTQPGDGR